MNSQIAVDNKNKFFKPSLLDKKMMHQWRDRSDITTEARFYGIFYSALLQNISCTMNSEASLYLDNALTHIDEKIDFEQLKIILPYLLPLAIKANSEIKESYITTLSDFTPKELKTATSRLSNKLSILCLFAEYKFLNPDQAVRIFKKLAINKKAFWHSTAITLSLAIALLPYLRTRDFARLFDKTLRGLYDTNKVISKKAWEILRALVPYLREEQICKILNYLAKPEGNRNVKEGVCRLLFNVLPRLGTKPINQIFDKALVLLKDKNHDARHNAGILIGELPSRLLPRKSQAILTYALESMKGKYGGDAASGSRIFVSLLPHLQTEQLQQAYRGVLALIGNLEWWGKSDLPAAQFITALLSHLQPHQSKAICMRLSELVQETERYSIRSKVLAVLLSDLSYLSLKQIFVLLESVLKPLHTSNPYANIHRAFGFELKHFFIYIKKALAPEIFANEQRKIFATLLKLFDDKSLLSSIVNYVLAVLIPYLYVEQLDILLEKIGELVQSEDIFNRTQGCEALKLITPHLAFRNSNTIFTLVCPLLGEKDIRIFEAICEVLMTLSTRLRLEQISVVINYLFNRAELEDGDIPLKAFYTLSLLLPRLSSIYTEQFFDSTVKALRASCADLRSYGYKIISLWVPQLQTEEINRLIREIQDLFKTGIIESGHYDGSLVSAYALLTVLSPKLKQEQLLAVLPPIEALSAHNVYEDYGKALANLLNIASTQIDFS